MKTRTQRLSQLLAGIAPVDAAHDVAINAITLDSRTIKPGTLFIALPGLHHDGRAFIQSAVGQGATAIVYDAKNYRAPALAIPALAVTDLAMQLGTIADRFYDAPSRRVLVIGVTGTNGKTTCSQLIAQALDRAPRRCGVVGTLGYGFPGALAAGMHTTPDAITVHRLLDEFDSAGAVYASMEVSSHALDQGRVNGVAFELAVFTNLTRDHLDYHGDMTRYAAAKSRLFHWSGLKTAVINRDDTHGRRLIAELNGSRTQVMTYGLTEGDVYARRLESTRDGLRLLATTPQGDADIQAPLFGKFNASNLLASLATLLALGLDPVDAARRLSAVQPVPGRAERFQGNAAQPLVVVDYAHTPDALEQVLSALRPHVEGKLWCVFGCGGDRDRGKRPQMGAIAERLADIAIVTDDNPRHESGDAIVADIVAGMQRSPRVVRDRRRAIAAALSEASSSDVVVVAGKGHEDYQQVGDVRHPYSDRETVRALLELAA